MTKHTPGPWEVQADNHSVMVLATHGGMAVIISEVGRKPTPEDKANAAVIAAAPDLLDALQELDQRLRKCFAEPITANEAYDSFYQEIVAAAVAKAESSK